MPNQAFQATLDSALNAMFEKRTFYHRGHREHREGIMGKDPFTGKVIGCAIETHRVLGPGLPESAFRQCLAHERRLNEIPFKVEHPMPIDCKGVRLDCGCRIGVLADERLVLEPKAVEEVGGIHKARLPTCMKLSGIGIGLSIGFNVRRLADGIDRFGIQRSLWSLCPLW